MKKRLSLDALEVKSFVTNKKEVALGGIGTLFGCPFNTMQCSEAYTICCPDTETQIPVCL